MSDEAAVMLGLMVFAIIWFGLFAVLGVAIAHVKGRSKVGWGIGTACSAIHPLFLIPVIIVLCVLPDLKAQKAKEQRVERENRRLREQLRQEQMKSESFRQHASARLDAHDNHMGLDTRRTLPEGQAAPAQLEAFGMSGGSASLESGDDGDLAQLANASNDTGFTPIAPPQVGAPPPAPPRRERSWHYEQSGEAHGPIEERRLIAMFQSGELDGATLVWTEALTDWKPADEISSLRPYVQF